MTTYLSVLIVLFGITLLWKAVSLSGAHFISSKLSRLRAKAGMYSLDNAGKHSSDTAEVNSIIASCQYMIDNFSIRKFLVALTLIRKNRELRKNTYTFSDPELEKISAEALNGTMAYLPMLSPSLFLILMIAGGAIFFKEGYGATRQTLATMTCYFAEYGFIPLDDSRRLA